MLLTNHTYLKSYICHATSLNIGRPLNQKNEVHNLELLAFNLVIIPHTGPYKSIMPLTITKVLT